MRSQTMTFTIAPIVLLVLTLPNDAASSPNPCVQVYANAINRVAESRSEQAALDDVYRRVCSASQRDLSGGFDSSSKAIISAIPVASKFAARFNATSNKSYCEAYERHSFTYSASSTYEEHPLDFAGKNFNQCVQFHSNSNVFITHEHTIDGNLAIDISVPEDTSLRIEGLISKDFSCSLPTQSLIFGAGSTSLGVDTRATISRSTTVGCSRDPIAKGGDSHFPATSVQLRTSKGTYTVEVPNTTVLGPDTKEELVQQLSSAELRANQLDAKLNGVTLVLAKLFVSCSNTAYHINPTHGHYFATTSTEWHGDANKLWERVKSKLCPSGRIELMHTGSASGGACGTNFYVAACLTYPN